MISKQFAGNFSGDSGIDVGVQEFDAVFPDGERRRIILRIGMPFRKEDDENYYIRVELEELDRTDCPLFGVSTLQAIIAAMFFLRGRLKVFEEKHGCRYFWPGTNIAVDYEDYFKLT